MNRCRALPLISLLLGRMPSPMNDSVRQTGAHFIKSKNAQFRDACLEREIYTYDDAAMRTIADARTKPHR